MSDKKSVIIALGYFDSVHIGHVKVISTAVKTAKEQGVIPAVFTFKGDLKKAVGKKEDKCVFTYKEREKIIHALGVKEILFATANREFIGKTKIEFLDYLNTTYDIKGYVSGQDYTFGCDRGTVNDLIEYAKMHGQTVKTVNLLKKNGEKIATTTIKEYLKNGKIEKANKELFVPYFITGKVFHDRNEGVNLGYPTANIKINKIKQPLKLGVYFGFVKVGKDSYRAVINYGNRPTYNLYENLIEVHLLDFNGDLYGKTIKVTFIKRIRDVKKFKSEKELSARIEKDVKIAKEVTK